MENFWIIVILGTSIWVFIDARNIGVKKGLITGIANMSPVMWLISCLFLWIIAFPIYLIKRPELKRAASADGADNGSVNGMVFCRGCGKQIHSSAANCPKCGAKQ